ncbi:hypothetical protein ACFWXK_02835 [Streptomyces sp. NPDC059070]|uniref:hypothetical protein n=1 Tax=Streptomyces sp. NPDC059070 TaxID=3346713 RepID=UPI003693140F
MRNRRTALRGAVAGTMATAALVLAAGGASAKSDISFDAGPRTARLGAAVHLAGHGSDDNSTYNRFCVQQRSGSGGWVNVRCSRGGYNGGGSLDLTVRPSHRGQWQYRAVLTEASSPTSKRQWIHQSSAVRTVHVR